MFTALANVLAEDERSLSLHWTGACYGKTPKQPCLQYSGWKGVSFILGGEQRRGSKHLRNVSRLALPRWLPFFLKLAGRGGMRLVLQRRLQLSTLTSRGRGPQQAWACLCGACSTRFHSPLCGGLLTTFSAHPSNTTACIGYGKQMDEKVPVGLLALTSGAQASTPLSEANDTVLLAPKDGLQFFRENLSARVQRKPGCKGTGSCLTHRTVSQQRVLAVFQAYPLACHPRPAQGSITERTLSSAHRTVSQQ